MDLATLLKTEMDRRGWSLNRTAEECGLAASHISRIVNRNGEEPRMETLAKISSALEIPFPRLIEAAGYPVINYSLAKEQIELAKLVEAMPEFRALAEHFQQLDYRSRMSLIAVAKAFAEQQSSNPE